MRLQQSLAGLWQFQLDPAGKLRPDQMQPEREIAVPLPWQAAFPELESYSGYAWYRRPIALTDEWLRGELLLHFGAVDYACQVYVNGQMVAEHEGGYTAFTVPIRRNAHPGDNELAVRVFDAAKAEVKLSRWPDKQARVSAMPPADELPQGKQTWYLDASGIWQDVTLTAVDAVSIENVRVTPNIRTGEAQLTVRLRGQVEAGTIHARIGSIEVTQAVEPGQSVVHLTLKVADARLWTPETPELYTVIVALTSGSSRDEVSTRFGLREISTHDGKLLLNGEPLMLLSALDQDLYPETIYSVPSEDYLRDEFKKTKELGLNSLRCHIKPPDPIYLDLADEMGLIIWAEIPSWRMFQPKSSRTPRPLGEALQARVRQTLGEMIERDFNHPSLMIWTIINEDWGTELPLNADHRQWVVGMVDLCKQLDPTRLVVDNSVCLTPWGPNLHVKTDINDIHTYSNIPDHAGDFVGFVTQFGLRPGWSFTQHGDSLETGKEPLILSEFGNWGMPLLKSLMRDGEPDWFKLGPWWSSWDGEPGYPTGVLERFQALGLNKIWADYDTFAVASQWHQFAAFKFEIEAIRREKAIVGYVITELTDAYWESNGLLDFNREPKAYHHDFKQFNTEDVVIPELKRFAYWDDETVQAILHASHYSAEQWEALQLKTTLGGAEQTSTLDSLPRGECRMVGSFEAKLAPIAQPGVQVIETSVVDGQGQAKARNTAPIFVLPSSLRNAAYTQPVNVLGLDGTAFTESVKGLGYNVADSADSSLLIADFVTEDVLSRVINGTDLLLLSEGLNPFIWQHGRGGAYGGNWMTSFSWLRPGIYRRLQVSNPVSMPLMGITPESVFTGLPLEDARYHDDFLAGQFTGWIGHPALHTVQFRYGRGRVVMTSYRLKSALSSHPAAIAMLHDLVDHLTSDACQPTLTLNR